MRIEILGCSGSVLSGFDTMSILVDGKILLDAGSVMSTIGVDRATGIRTVLLTHPHIDHIKELPFLVDALYTHKAKGIRIIGSPQTIDALKAHIFNGLIWPDIAELDASSDFISLEHVPGGVFEIEGMEVRAFPTNHTGGAYGYVITENARSVLFSGDTGYHPGLFELVGELGSNLAACFIEASFPSRMEDLARITQHLTPALVAKGLDGVAAPGTRVILYHIKPAYLDEVIAELPRGFEYVRGGEVFVV